MLDNVNGYLADIGKELGIELKISSYVARHSYATVLKRSGVSTSVISESLGHSSERVTQIYLDSFETGQFNDAMNELVIVLSINPTCNYCRWILFIYLKHLIIQHYT